MVFRHAPIPRKGSGKQQQQQQQQQERKVFTDEKRSSGHHATMRIFQLQSHHILWSYTELLIRPGSQLPVQLAQVHFYSKPATGRENL